MTDEERQLLVEKKSEATERLASVNLRRYRLGEVDKRLSAYVREVAAHPELHNVFEQLAVLRFLDLSAKYGLNKSEIQRFVRFYEALHFPGKRGMTRYKLTPVQVFQFSSIFGFWDGGHRIVREACLFVPRKFSKTTSTAAIAVYDLLFGESNAEAYVGANSQDQAKKCFDVIRGCMKKLDPDGLYYVVNEQQVKPRRTDRSAIAQCLTANARTKDGLNASCVIMDEFSQARDNKLLTVLTTSMGIRDNPLTVIITTASDVFDGPFYSMLQGYKRILLGQEEADSVFAHIFEPDVDDPEDSELTWRKVQPHMGVTVSLDFYHEEFRAAKRNGADAMLAFRTKLLNVYTENEHQSWIPATLARRRMIHLEPEDIVGYPDAMIAIDLSVHDDFSAVSFGIYDERKYEFYFHTSYFFPREALPGHPNEYLYRKWAAAGYLILLDGDVIDYRAIADYVLSLNDHVHTIHIGYDGYKAQDCVNIIRAGILEQEGDPDAVLGAVAQSNGNFNIAVESFEHGMRGGGILINDNPINAYCFGNAVLSYDNNENKKPVKRSQALKIDGVITKLMCMRLFIGNIR